ncbi:DUF4260 domain-containing protein [Microvirga vignae]|uniref:DUF4260 domain-containing protein n=1 Tax=Microvirga vignae TaxID=1225564 RepID=UPI001910B5A4|nr:DUF4260 domain-containing protein [Microvirga vignae]
MTTRAAAGTPRLLLRLEGLVLLAAATWAFSQTSQSWWLYAALFFVPDVSFAAYATGSKPGSMAYSALHSTIGPAILGLAGLAFGSLLLLGVAAIWAAHVGFDRALGYGLKYATGFSDTHLGRIGRNPAGA